MSVSAGTVLPVRQYYVQTDSAVPGQAHRMCFSSTCAMAIKYLRPGALLGINADDTISPTAYGELDNPGGGYVQVGRGGHGVRYSWRHWLPRWEVEGPRTGWFMTYRLA
ncbi:hypothetical protein [Synechococcus sp. 8F6]|uniref:hypothetical protein n=1 Tax=Synechococcus sp. 8F6 TaxID=2025606 RepID=UPI000B993BB1|nr:hypothetical protein [Synechococcus sp. 8F6]